MNAETLDLEIHELDDGMWLAIAANGNNVAFPTEDAVCAFQRQWRQLHGLHPMTGEFL